MQTNNQTAAQAAEAAEARAERLKELYASSQAFAALSEPDKQFLLGYLVGVTTARAEAARPA